MGRFVPVNLDITIAEKTPPKHPGGRVYYDGKQCWQYKVVYDKPGAYTWTAPANAICARSVLVGGGGKPKCTTSGCCSWGGSGGAYSEKCMALGAGTEMCIVVGAQEQDTTLSCEGTPVHTAGGAAGCTLGVASGGDWDSNGGQAGWTCNHCGGSLSHHCGSCICFEQGTCCGYCVVYAYKPSQTGSTTCCNLNLVGGASAGSPKNLCGGRSQTTCGKCHSGVIGGGGGIGTQCCQQVWHYPCCSCICTCNCTGWHYATQYPMSVAGGGGSAGSLSKRGCRSWEGECMGGLYQTGAGGKGGPEEGEPYGFEVEFGMHNICAFPYGGGYGMPEVCIRTPGSPACKVDWWDISDICGTGSPGAPGELIEQGNCQCRYGLAVGQRPDNAGEGAGTGGTGSYCCDPGQSGQMWGANYPVNWCLVCCLGTLGWEDQAWKMIDHIVPMHLTCAGTLGGSGAMGYCRYSSKAGKGGGGGQGKCHILCVCHGGSYDNCNGTGPALAFPPCLLDQLTSNAGTGMAIIYYKEA